MSERRELPRELARAIAWATLVTIVGLVMRPWFKDLATLGFHDWDAQESHRFLAMTSILRFHQFPGWDPYACGGFPAWGYIEGDTNVVSPFFPFYALLPMSVALRVEVLGMASLGAVGAYFVASRFTTSFAARALVAALWAVNGRWALQTASGHTWHLAYAFLPWILYFFEHARSLERKSLDLVLGGASIAMLVYAGGIYPIPHAALALGLYATLLALATKKARPLTTLVLLGAIGVALAAPKLLPIADAFGKAPRTIDSTEFMDLGAAWTMLTSRDQAFGSRPVRVMAYGWHEWGIYIGTIGALLLIGAFILVRGARETSLKIVAFVLVLLGFGAFHADAPWTWLHKAPVFRSQHVPSRFLYPAILFGALVLAAGLGRLIDKGARRLRWLDAIAAVLVLALGVDVALVASKPMADAMWMLPPDKIVEKPFHFEQDPPLAYKKRDWAGPMYLAMRANTGVINCYGTPPFERKGALAVSSPKYRGEARVEGGGTATVAAWSPNRVDIDVHGAKPGALLVYNMNFDEGWHASGGEVVDADAAIGVRLASGEGRVVLSYTPPNLWLGVFIALIAVARLVFVVRRERARRVEESVG